MAQAAADTPKRPESGARLSAGGSEQLAPSIAQAQTAEIEQLQQLLSERGQPRA